jgi:hypothetical protein
VFGMFRMTRLATLAALCMAAATSETEAQAGRSAAVSTALLKQCPVISYQQLGSPLGHLQWKFATRLTYSDGSTAWNCVAGNSHGNVSVSAVCGYQDAATNMHNRVVLRLGGVVSSRKLTNPKVGDLAEYFVTGVKPAIGAAVVTEQRGMIVIAQGSVGRNLKPDDAIRPTKPMALQYLVSLAQPALKFRCK